jgi:hypothetical protein
MFLDEKLFINMYLNNDLDKLYNVDVFIVSDKKTDKLLDLFREGKTKKLKMHKLFFYIYCININSNHF